jgi:hypothetical protein
VCVITDDAHYTIYEEVELVITTFAKVQKPYLKIRISIHYQVWQVKTWKTFLYTYLPLFKIIVAIVS